MRLRVNNDEELALDRDNSRLLVVVSMYIVPKWFVKSLEKSNRY